MVTEEVSTLRSALAFLIVSAEAAEPNQTTVTGFQIGIHPVILATLDRDSYSLPRTVVFHCKTTVSESNKFKESIELVENRSRRKGGTASVATGLNRSDKKCALESDSRRFERPSACPILLSSTAGTHKSPIGTYYFLY